MDFSKVFFLDEPRICISVVWVEAFIDTIMDKWSWTELSRLVGLSKEDLAKDWNSCNKQQIQV